MGAATRLKSLNQPENNYGKMFPTEVCATIRFNFSVFNLWIEPSTPQNPDGPGMVNTGLEEFPSHIPKLLNKWKTQPKLIKIGLIQIPWELHHRGGVEVHRSVADAVKILLVQNSKGIELSGSAEQGSRSPQPWPELRDSHEDEHLGRIQAGFAGSSPPSCWACSLLISFVN